MRVLIVEDDPDLLSVLARWCTSEGFEVGTAGGYREAIIQGPVSYDVAVIDLYLNDGDGLRLSSEFIQECNPSPKVILITGFPSISSAICAVRESQIVDYLVKPIEDLRVLSAAIHRAGQPAVSSPARPLGLRENYIDLTQREREIAKFISMGFRSSEIGRALGLSERTIRNAMSSLYQKLGVRDRVEACIRLRKSPVPQS